MSKVETVGEQWQKVLKSRGYGHVELTSHSFAKQHRYSRVWKRLHRVLTIPPNSTFFELGCGGGKHLVPLAFHGHHVAGIDVSSEVLGRCRAFIKNVEKFAGRALPITLYQGDFLTFTLDPVRYDIVFNFGVIEHFIDDSERLFVLRKMFALAKPGGYVVSVVPNGMHPMRTRQRAEGLGGYTIPEIDYTNRSAMTEMLRAGAINSQVYSADLWAHLTLDINVTWLGAKLRRIAYYTAQLVPPVPSEWTFQHAGSLIIIGQKPYLAKDAELSD